MLINCIPKQFLPKITNIYKPKKEGAMINIDTKHIGIFCHMDDLIP
jgi:hypothetical protein